jgi:alpha-galactosidase
MPISQADLGGLAVTPPWAGVVGISFGCHIDEDIVRREADALAISGMREAGYRYVIIDDCWQGDRDANGVIQADSQRFPSGI